MKRIYKSQNYTNKTICYENLMNNKFPLTNRQFRHYKDKYPIPDESMTSTS